ncbi:hypothetical protein PI124_g15510 [Phytophthora idaei]|nr:hypothetical protein PI125_g13242 [Phytophthora idaei]KAG3151256.1 hypothetical protein PI126_g11084 [Phytophthora idaei]KAG3239571.1 hypothetical protein PI124_g15510 [Phytophthora idaei]
MKTSSTYKHTTTIDLTVGDMVAPTSVTTPPSSSVASVQLSRVGPIAPVLQLAMSAPSLSSGSSVVASPSSNSFGVPNCRTYGQTRE